MLKQIISSSGKMDNQDFPQWIALKRSTKGAMSSSIL